MRTRRQRSGAKASGGRQPKTVRKIPEGLPRAALDTLRAQIAVLDEQGTVLQVNRAWSEFLDGDRAHATLCKVGSNFLLACRASADNPIPGHTLADGIRAVISGQTEDFSLECPFPGVAGTDWYEVSVTRYFDANSLRIVVARNDITRRKQEEAKRAWLQMFLEAQANSSLDGIMVVDSAGDKKIFKNQRCIDLLGIPSHIAESDDGETMRRWALEMVKYPELFLAPIKFLYAHPKEKSRDEIALKNGQFLDRYSAPVLGDDGTLYGRIWTFRDITERKRMEESIRESEARFQRITDNVPGMVYRYLLQADGRAVFPFVSEGSRKIYGLDPQAVQNDSRLMDACIHPDDREEHDRSVAASVASLSPWNWQGRIRRADTGEIRHVQGASQPELQPNGDILWDGVMVDVTENKQAEEDRRTKEEAVRMNEAKSEFLSRMSHELRTPLNAILGFGQVLEMSSLGEQETQSVQYILKGGRHLLSLVDQVLDMARAEKDELSLHLATFPLEAVVRDCVGQVSQMAQERGITCIAQPDTTGQIPIRADKQRLRQVLLNLLANAIAYNREGGRVEVSSCTVPGGKVRCQVKDTGAGISPEGLTRLFVPFDRLGKELGDTTGTGLALAVSRRLTEAMGGTLGVESRIDVGSTFWIELPAGPVDALPLSGIVPELAPAA